MTSEPPTRAPSRRGGAGPSALVGLLGELMVTLGVLLLLFVAWQLWWTDVAAGRAQAGEVRSLQREFAAAREQATLEVREGETFAVVRVPRFGEDYARPVIEGTAHEVLDEGVGHYVDTALPGEKGNFAVAGHRVTYGRPFHDIDRLTRGDAVVVETVQGWFVYTVTSHQIVTPGHTEVIAPVPGRPGARPTESWLTLTACHPRYSAAERYVVHAELARTYPREQGLPATVLTRPGT